MGKLADFFRRQSVTLSQTQKREMLNLDAQLEALESKVKVLEAENLNLQADTNPLQREVERLQDEIKRQRSGNPDGFPCDHRGSKNLKRIGTRPNPHFVDAGIKDAIFNCLDCGGESGFMQKPSV